MSVSTGLLLAALLLRWHPLALFAVTLSLVRVCHISRPMPRILSATALTAYAALLAWYVTCPEFTDHLEPTLGILTELFRRGEPLYHAPDSSARYAMLYGPVLYPIRSLFVTILGPGVLSVKLPGVLASLLALLCVHAALRSLTATALTALACACFGPIAYFGKADPLMLACTALALAAAVRAPRITAILLTAVALGVSTNLKPPAALNFLPVLWILWQRFGFISALQSSACAACVTLLPYTLLPEASLPDYLHWLHSAGKHGIDAGILVRNLEWSALLLAPSLLRFRRDDAVLIVLTALTLLVSSLAGSKTGGGIGHLLPIVPVCAYLATRRTDDPLARQIALALAVTFLAVALPLQSNIATALRERATANAREDVLAFGSAHPTARIQVGYGLERTYPLTDHRLWLVQSGHPVLVDAGALMDIAAAVGPLPASTVAALRADATTHWLLPKGDEPFSLGNRYPPHGPLFDPAFRAAFREAFHLSGSTRLFDVWTRRSRPGT